MKHLSHALSPRLAAPLATVGTACALLLGTLPQQARADDTCPSLAVPAAAQRHLLAEADQGIGALRRYIEITEPIYGLDLDEVVAWMDARRAGKCQ